ncbi:MULTISPECIES: anti-sigma regulatory factor [unclassified Fictibacillus]|uniref:anti-sigma regulatory factor n=1 Tax=unclassified Fictibacillus TaxID=2644029 RepID=UPI0006A7AE39|nr:MULTISPECIES: anti-sigma regulatory factor [unclassified Fictibacillus]MED2971629.1 anti-sigma regulatory factor [Fictibacillus sp. B-59209]SFD43671.1 serine/threonine-protein kinase RsbT [Bacillus sp. OV194]
MNYHQVTVEIKNELDISIARQEGKELARIIGFNSVNQVRIKTVISELARNIYLYAGEGKIIVEAIEEENRAGIRVSAIDQGPGIQDIKMALQAGYTSSGGLGAGLPGVQKLMDIINVQSTLNLGTEITAIKWCSEKMMK